MVVGTGILAAKFRIPWCCTNSKGIRTELCSPPDWTLRHQGARVHSCVPNTVHLRIFVVDMVDACGRSCGARSFRSCGGGGGGGGGVDRPCDATSVLSAKWNLVYMRCRYIVDYAKAKGRALDVTSWRQDGPRDCDCPQQSNEVDCGAFVCMFAVHAAHDMPLAFSQDDMPAVRRHIVCSILLGDGC